MAATAIQTSASPFRFRDKEPDKTDLKQAQRISFQVPLSGGPRRGIQIDLHMTDINGSPTAIANAAAPVIAGLFGPWLRKPNAGPISKGTYAGFLAALQSKLEPYGQMRFCQNMGYLN